MTEVDRDQMLRDAMAALQTDTAEAERLAGAILKTHPGHPFASRILARARIAQDRLDEAIAALQNALQIFPAAGELRVELAELLLQRNDRAGARYLLADGLAGQPPDAVPGMALALAQVMYLEGDYEAAAEQFRRGLAHRPDDAMAHKNLGLCLLETGARGQGEASLKAAVRLAPELAGEAVVALAAASRGRFFLRPSAAAAFLKS